MGIYKCINCGEEKESKKVCQCGKCGYLMYAAPYEKINILKNEIKTFIKNIRVTKIKNTDLIFEGSEKDEKSFPTYEKIINYVCSAQKTEQFFERTAQSMVKIKNHLLTPFSAKYNVNISRLTAHEEDLNYTLSESIEAVNLQYDIPKITYPKISVVFEEIIDDKAVEQVIEILELCKALLDKIKKLSGEIISTMPDFRISTTIIQICSLLKTRTNGTKQQLKLLKKLLQEILS